MSKKAKPQHKVQQTGIPRVGVPKILMKIRGNTRSKNKKTFWNGVNKEDGNKSQQNVKVNKEDIKKESASNDQAAVTTTTAQRSKSNNNQQLFEEPATTATRNASTNSKQQLAGTTAARARITGRPQPLLDTAEQ